MALVVTGRLVTMDPARPVVDDGRLYVGDDGLIEAVLGPGEPEPAGFTGATRIATGSSVYPGLVDLHSHLLYNLRSLWTPARAAPYTSREQWPRDPSYSAAIHAPAAVLAKTAAKAVLKYAEAKAVVGGTTAIQGSPTMTRSYEGWLVRNVERETFGTGRDFVFQSVVTQDDAGLAGYAAKMRAGAAFIYHLAEGTNPVLVREFDAAETAGCLQPGFIGIHATALDAAAFARWRPAGAVVWSPFSNLWLYRGTTDVVAARDAGVVVCLGADWGPSGSKNVLGELKVADLWNETHLGRAFTAEELCAMATVNAGVALGTAWGERIGRLARGLQADLAVFASRRPDPHRNLIDSTERNVRLVMVAGRAVYGSRRLMTMAGAGDAETITVAGIPRAIRMVDPAVPDADMSWTAVRQALEQVGRDPARAFDLAMAAPRDFDAEPPLELIPDMPAGDLPLDVRAAADLGPVVMPPLDSIYHDGAFFRALARDRAPILDGLLDGLAGYYRRGA